MLIPNLVPNVVSHDKSGNEWSIAWVQGIRILSQQPSSILYWTETQHPWLKNNITHSEKGTLQWKCKSEILRHASNFKSRWRLIGPRETELPSQEKVKNKTVITTTTITTAKTITKQQQQNKLSPAWYFYGKYYQE